MLFEADLAVAVGVAVGAVAVELAVGRLSVRSGFGGRRGVGAVRAVQRSLCRLCRLSQESCARAAGSERCALVKNCALDMCEASHRNGRNGAAFHRVSRHADADR